MKILLFMEATLGGTARHLLDLATGLLDRGHEVHIVASELRASQAFPTGVETLRQEYPAFRYHIIPVRREVCLSDLRVLWRISRYLRTFGPFDILHAHSTKAGFLLRLAFPRGRAAVLYTAHGLMLMDPGLTGWRWRAVALLEAGLARISDAIITVSGKEAACAIAAGLPAGKIVTIGNGLFPVQESASSARDNVRRQLGISADAVCIGWVGRLVPGKQPQRFLDALKALQHSTSHKIQALIVGWGPLDQELQTRAHALGLHDTVHFLGEVRAIDYLPAFDILAHTSLYEGFAYVFLEALAAGVPIVTTCVGVADEILDRTIGGVCDPWSVDAFARELQRFVDDPGLRADAAPLARARAAQFDGETMLNATVTLYQRVRKTVALRAVADPTPPVLK